MTRTQQLKWITNDWGLIDEHKVFERQHAVYFRKEFIAKNSVKSASLTIYSNGITNIYMNGLDVGREYLAPGPAEFTNTLPYRVYDAKEFIQDKNALLVVAGDGWYCGETVQRRRAQHVYGVKIALTLDITYTDGSSQTIETDDTWQTMRGAIGLNDIYHGEDFDARKPHLEYSFYGYDCKDADFARLTKVSQNKLIEYDIAPVRKISEINPEFIKRSSSGARLYDLKQNLSGVLEIKVKGERGQKIVMRHGEVLTTDGKDLYTQNLRIARATDSYTLKGGEVEVYIPTTTYHGFRYAEISFDESKVELISVKGIVLHTDLKQSGSFECDNELFNKIYSCALWGAKSNLVCIPTDCPQRNERFGWLADAQVFTKTAVSMYDCEKFYEYFLKIIEDATIEEGNVPVFAPRIPGIGSRDAVFGWSDAVIIIPYVVYTYYGNKEIINRFAPLMKEYMGFCHRRRPEYLQVDMKYGDWLNAGQETDRMLIATAYYAHSAKLLSCMLKEINDDEWKKYDELFYSIKKAFREKFWNEEIGRLTEPSQTAYALSSCFELITPDECKDGLLEELAKYDNHIMCGFMGANLILPALCECGLKELACKLMLTETYPSWGYCIRNGATTFWERWDSYRAETNSYEEEEGMNSFNHYSFGSCVEWFFTYLLGINPTKAGFDRVQIKPFVPKIDNISTASGYYDTKYGRISVEWKRVGNEAIVTVIKPENVLADFVFDNIISIEQDGEVRSNFDEQASKTCVKIKL